ncbi:(2Fe-2S)-binding protein [Rhodospirillum rubrum]|uniref:Bacterioferritin-associated ferredoxin n=1 Tax=Rhodospirillum rubrum (strain ATCC 11170 / ATH 1.1.1 / DSM 467 / LMG 4362 / NCIMB 8255 / S1) TaxID=269796 RepID=Q2RS99_RHORT|nr:(2Fe-2S)-binding protein [Rhodospirillum rubrum]ABC22996.1 BFD-like (2Fe-2S)-binding region [Rhodospirillum rubrum ATCC 11170]AEO48725.1 BFD-like (2Fe-2S)-binding region [Rhodospirillum rubrum F11]MBK5954619.1 (2Fe-2S)-binding protein [Rhodospirillum rubrum]QXG78980.1 (2Fe-2S)-binding protein [Rhodospirillum rubrum]HAP98772.1 (2Fe-2S)-binding protein [Rhodospirillum rubrum]
MYVCICNALTDRHVREDVQGGARSAGAVFARRGVRPVCGKCGDCMRALVRETRETSSSSADVGALLMAAE